MALILDTSVLFASLDRDDGRFAPCRSLIDGSEEPLIVPTPVLPELDYLVRRRLNVGVMLAFLSDVRRGAFRLEDPIDSDYARAAEVMDRYSSLDVGLVDATILSVTERMSEAKLATLDHRHFSVMRPRHVDALELVPA